ncbi:MAG: Uma2 family endonuclease [Bryobacter sp.]|nr:Uma2 family endonuclease [Bryobacter sp.]
MSSKTLMTVEDFAQLKLGETEDYELVEGELVPLSSGTPKHAEIRGFVEFLLRIYFQQHKSGRVLAEVDCQLDQSTVRRPDVSIFLAPRSRQFDARRIPIPFPPDIAIEVLSPNELAVDVNRKVRDYLSAGTAEVWQLDEANGEIFVHTADAIRLLRNEDALTSPLLPGFAATAKDLLAGSLNLQ